jgi:cytosine/adenosine deaminase-related metal-dependent hydrolase
VCIEDDRILAVGKYADLAAVYRPARVMGGPDTILVPGLVNAHDHGRAPSALQLGVPDDVLEAWIVDLLRLPALDTRSSVALSALEQLERGITCSSNSFYVRSDYYAELEATAAGYRDAGLRVALIASTMDQSVVADLLAAIEPQLSFPLQSFVRDFLAARLPLEPEEYFAALSSFPAYSADYQHTLLAGPVSLHWCSEKLLEQIWRIARKRGLSLQTHLLESSYQSHTSRLRYGGQSAVVYMQQKGWLQSDLSCAHCVHVSVADMDLLSAARVSVVHNASSNLRLRNGVAPVPQMLAAGINVALGLDSQTLNDDADMWQEMRLVARLHQTEEAQISSRQVWAMATINGARALGMEPITGSLAVGKKADLLLIDAGSGSARAPSLPTNASAEHVFDRLVLLTAKEDIAVVLVDGKVRVKGGEHLLLDRDLIASRLQSQLAMETGSSAFAEHVAALKPALRRYLAAISR